MLSSKTCEILALRQQKISKKTQVFALQNSDLRTITTGHKRGPSTDKSCKRLLDRRHLFLRSALRFSPNLTMHQEARLSYLSSSWKLSCTRHPARRPNLSTCTAGSKREKIFPLLVPFPAASSRFCGRLDICVSWQDISLPFPHRRRKTFFPPDSRNYQPREGPK